MSKALDIGGMFAYGIFNNGDPTNAQSKPLTWYLPKVTEADYVFYEQGAFNQDVSTWFTPQNGDVMQVQNLQNALCTRQGSSWYKYFNNGGSPNINNWRTPNATDISLIFSRCPEFNQPINDWDVSNVTNMSSMFYGATAFNQPLNNWNTSKATTLATMFFNASAFNQDLSAWNTGNATTMTSMFAGAPNFNNGDTGDNSAKPLPWDVSKVTNFSSMFSSATSFNQDISTWNVSAATTFASMFSGASKFNSYIGAWNPALATTFASMFQNAAAFNNGDPAGTSTKPLAWTNTGSVTTLASMFSGAAAFNQNVSNWNLSSATTLASMFLNAAAFNNGDPAGVSTKPLAWSNTGAVTTLASMFSGARRFNQSLSSFNTSNVTSLASTFVSANSFNQDIAAWDVSKVTSFNSTFNGAASLKRDLSAWSVSAGTDFTNMFTGTDINLPGTTDNYDNVLLSLANSTAQNSKSFNAGGARYSYTGLGDAAAGTGRAHLTAPSNASPTPGHAWSITDGGSANCTFSSSSGLLATCDADRATFTRIVFKTTSTLPTGITAGTAYWTVRVSSKVFRLATSLANAQASTVIAFTDSGSGTHAMMNLGHTFTASNSSGSLLLTLGTGGELNFSGRKVRFVTSGTLPTGLLPNTDYRLNRVTAGTYRVMTDVVDSVNGTNPIAFTDSGSGTHELLFQ
jgi:surface protein